MPVPIRSLALSLFLALGASALYAQSPQAAGPAVDRLFRISASLPPGSFAAGPSTEAVTFAIYENETGGDPIWQETQTLAVDAQGNYSVLLGATSVDGLPVNLFAGGAPRWLSVQAQGKGAARTLLTAVPYAVSAVTAANADNLGGRPASDYLLTPSARSAGGGLDATSAASAAEGLDRPQVNNGTANFIGKFFNNVDLINSSLYDAGGTVGLNTTTPLDVFHSRFTNAGGTQTGIAVQNLSGGANAYSGMLFYDQNGALGQFQGFNNSTHEYRINNIATNGSINFMTGSDSKFKILNNGNIGLGSGTRTPLVRLQNYGNSVADVTFSSLRHGGTISAPTAIASGANLLRLEGGGYNGTAFTTEKGFLQIVSTEAWTSTANGTEINFGTTANGSTAVTQRMTILNNGDVEVGTGSESVKFFIGPLAGNAGNLSVSADGNGAQGVAMFDRLNDDGTLVRFRRNGLTQGTIDVAAGVVSYNAFTGSHFAQTDEAIERGMLVSLNGRNGRLEDNPGSEILYGVSKSQRPNDPAVLGAYLARQNASSANLSNSVNPHLVEAVGNGEMWVVDTGRDLAAGDYLVSSAVAGHAMRDPGTFQVSNIVARLGEAVDWSRVTDTVRGVDGREHKRALVSVFFESFVIDRTRDAEITSLNERIAALEAALKSLTTTIQQQR